MIGMNQNSPLIKGKKPHRNFEGSLTPQQQKLVTDNLNLVIKVYGMLSRRIILKPHWSEDFLQQGRLGLCAAALRWDPNAGTKFSSFAYPYIRGYMIHYERDQTRVVKLDQKTYLGRIKISALEQSGYHMGEILNELEIDKTEYWVCKLSHLEDYLDIND